MADGRVGGWRSYGVLIGRTLVCRDSVLLRPCLYSVVPTGLTFRRVGWWMDGLEGDAPTEFGAEDAFIAGVPLRYTPACIITSLRDYFCLVLQDILGGASG